MGTKGFTLIEMIAAMVLASIVMSAVGLMARGSMMNLVYTNSIIDMNKDAEYAQRSFMMHVNGCSSFTNGSLTTTQLSFTNYLNGAEYIYQISTLDSTIKCSRTLSGNTVNGVLLNGVINGKFVYKDNRNQTLPSPTDATIVGVELTFDLLRGENTQSYTTFVHYDKNQLEL
tara:strand:- start:22 stop:537 length:516 start_codon:yes stop_codon:yes gene_type:complete